jgi:hypothetical protein
MIKTSFILSLALSPLCAASQTIKPSEVECLAATMPAGCYASWDRNTRMCNQICFSPVTRPSQVPPVTLQGIPPGIVGGTTGGNAKGQAPQGAVGSSGALKY